MVINVELATRGKGPKQKGTYTSLATKHIIIIIMHKWDVDIVDHTLKHHTRGPGLAIHINGASCRHRPQ